MLEMGGIARPPPPILIEGKFGAPPIETRGVWGSLTAMGGGGASLPAGGAGGQVSFFQQGGQFGGGIWGPPPVTTRGGSDSGVSPPFVLYGVGADSGPTSLPPPPSPVLM